MEGPLQNQFWRAQKVGLVWSAPVPSKDNDKVSTNGGRGENVWGPKPFLGRGFMVCFSPSLICVRPLVLQKLVLCVPFLHGW